MSFGGVDDQWFGGQDGFILWRMGDCAGCGCCVADGLKMLHDLGVFGRIGCLSFREEVQELYFMCSLVQNILLRIHEMITHLVSRRHGRIYKSETRIPRILLKPFPHNLRKRLLHNILRHGDATCGSDEGAIQGESCRAMPRVAGGDECRARHGLCEEFSG